MCPDLALRLESRCRRPSRTRLRAPQDWRSPAWAPRISGPRHGDLAERPARPRALRGGPAGARKPVAVGPGPSSQRPEPAHPGDEPRGPTVAGGGVSMRHSVLLPVVGTGPSADPWPTSTRPRTPGSSRTTSPSPPPTRPSPARTRRPRASPRRLPSRRNPPGPSPRVLRPRATRRRWMRPPSPRWMESTAGSSGARPQRLGSRSRGTQPLAREPRSRPPSPSPTSRPSSRPRSFVQGTRHPRTRTPRSRPPWVMRSPASSTLPSPPRSSSIPGWMGRGWTVRQAALSRAPALLTSSRAAGPRMAPRARACRCDPSDGWASAPRPRRWPSQPSSCRGTSTHSRA